MILVCLDKYLGPEGNGPIETGKTGISYQQRKNNNNLVNLDLWTVLWLFLKTIGKNCVLIGGVSGQCNNVNYVLGALSGQGKTTLTVY